MAGYSLCDLNRDRQRWARLRARRRVMVMLYCLIIVGGCLLALWIRSTGVPPATSALIALVPVGAATVAIECWLTRGDD